MADSQFFPLRISFRPKVVEGSSEAKNDSFLVNYGLIREKNTHFRVVGSFLLPQLVCVLFLRFTGLMFESLNGKFKTSLLNFCTLLPTFRTSFEVLHLLPHFPHDKNYYFLPFSSSFHVCCLIFLTIHHILSLAHSTLPHSMHCRVHLSEQLTLR